jgi:hypothetical protein
MQELIANGQTRPRPARTGPTRRRRCGSGVLVATLTAAVLTVAAPAAVAAATYPPRTSSKPTLRIDLGSPGGGTAIGVHGGTATAARTPAGHALPATGIVPPNNPPKNITPSPNFETDGACITFGDLDNSAACLTNIQRAISYAHTKEPGLGAVQYSIAGMASLSTPEQLFAIADIERVERGLPPAVELTTQLDNYSQTGANDNKDPVFPGGASINGGGQLESWGSNWAGGTINATASDYLWMYEDGYGGENLDCTSPTASGCWGHRDNILGTFLFPDFCSGPSELIMGGAVNRTAFDGSPSFAEIFVGDCGPMPPDVVITWTQVQTALRLSAPPSPIVGIASTPHGGGYWVVDSAGKVWNLGNAPNLGGLASVHLSAAIIGIAANPVADGFWLIASDGGVFSFGAVKFYGSEGGAHLNKPIVAMAASLDGKGYWFVGGDGGIFTFGDAKYHGSEGGHHLNKPVVGMAADPASGGYWLVAGDGGVFAFDAKFYGSAGALHLTKPIIEMEAAGVGLGYRFVASDGGIFAYAAKYYGSEGGQSLSAPIAGMAGDPATGGYWMVGQTGSVEGFHAPFEGNA